MANERESPITVVIDNKRKMLTSLTKREMAGSGVSSSSDADNKAIGGEAEPNPCMLYMRNVVSRICSSTEESKSQDSPVA